MSGDILTIRRTCLVRQHQKDRRSWRECILSILRKSGNAHVGGELAQHSLLTMVGRYIEVEEREVSTVGLSATAGVMYGDSRQMRSVAEAAAVKAERAAQAARKKGLTMRPSWIQSTQSVHLQIHCSAYLEVALVVVVALEEEAAAAEGLAMAGLAAVGLTIVVSAMADLATVGSIIVASATVVSDSVIRAIVMGKSAGFYLIGLISERSRHAKMPSFSNWIFSSPHSPDH